MRSEPFAGPGLRLLGGHSQPRPARSPVPAPPSPSTHFPRAGATLPSPAGGAEVQAGERPRVGVGRVPPGPHPDSGCSLVLPGPGLVPEPPCQVPPQRAGPAGHALGLAAQILQPGGRGAARGAPADSAGPRLPVLAGGVTLQVRAGVGRGCRGPRCSSCCELGCLGWVRAWVGVSACMHVLCKVHVCPRVHVSVDVCGRTHGRSQAALQC